MRTAFPILSSLASLAVAGVLSGCGVQQSANCGTGITALIEPSTGSGDHMATAPGDQVQFSALSGPGLQSGANGCVTSAIIAKLTPTWTASDAVNVKISSAQDTTNGLATCLGTTKSPVTVTATGTPYNSKISQTLGTATISCK